ncbi:PRK06851 family protein [Barrientosiimonas marina]|uniref:Nephrocystin 3-like N-terminal domain-containing protein n=1 Tax=Lentibacillus kimchii TaxID=1542911 RepID=A0ABW2UYZ0_9BACI
MSRLHYYVTGNTAKGPVNYLDSNLHNIDRVVLLKHPSVKLKTAVMKQLAESSQSNGLEILESSLARDYLDGIIDRNNSIAFIDSRIAGGGTETIDLEKTFPVKTQDTSDSDQFVQKAFDSFRKGLAIHDDELETIYVQRMDFDRADNYAEQFINALLKDVPEKDRTPHIYNRLFGTNTADGSVNVVPQLIEDITHVYYVKGRAGTGKSVLMKKVAKACETRGLDVELYYCSFDPESVDMVLVRELDFCMFDSTDPHEFFPQEETDVTIDLYEKLVIPGTDEKLAGKIRDVQARYKAHMKEGSRMLQKAGERRQQSEEDYMSGITDDAIRTCAETLQQTRS